jgi:hypothetical protein
MRAVLRTLTQCHAHKILHRDIKPGNFMLLTEAEDAPLKAIGEGCGCGTAALLVSRVPAHVLHPPHSCGSPGLAPALLRPPQISAWLCFSTQPSYPARTLASRARPGTWHQRCVLIAVFAGCWASARGPAARFISLAALLTGVTDVRCCRSLPALAHCAAGAVVERGARE